MSYRNRIGAICNDSTYSTATGRGAGSWHGGVKQRFYADSTPGTPSISGYSYSRYSGYSYSESSYQRQPYSRSYFDFFSKRRSGFSSHQEIRSATSDGFFKKCFKFILSVLYRLILIPILLVIGLIFLILQSIFKLIQMLYRKLRQTVIINGQKDKLKIYQFIKKCVKFILDIGYWILFISLFLIHWISSLILDLGKFLYKKLRQMMSLVSWKDEFGDLYTKMQIVTILFEKFFYYLIELPVRLISLLLANMVKFCYTGLVLVFQIVIFWLIIQALIDQDSSNKFYRQNEQISQHQPQIKEVKQKLGDLTKQVTRTDQTHISQTTTSQNHSQEQSSNTFQQTQQINKKTIQTDQKSPLIQEKQCQKKLTALNLQITKLKLQHQFEIEKLTLQNNITIQRLTQKIKKYQQAESSGMSHKIDSEEIIQEQRPAENSEGGEDPDEQGQEERLEQTQKVEQKIIDKRPSYNMHCSCCFMILKLILFLLGVLILFLLGVIVARIFCKVIQT